MSEQIRIEQDGRVLRVTFNRPEDNGVSDSMAAALSAALATAHETSDVVVVSSVGPDFCTGRIRDAGGPPAAEAYARRPEYDAIFNSYKSVRSAQVPVVGILRGRVMGYGTALAALCDVSFAADTATFNIPEITHNVMPTMVMSALYDRVNRNAILWMAYSAEFIDAKQAKDWGIVSQVVAQDKLDATAAGFLDVLLSRPRPAILGLKEYLRVAPRMDEQAAIDYARALHSMVNTSAAMKKAH
ncbi:enoyl-CoA hydratase [Variovorax paradoxus]|jgi:enoyl-CoA hydratase|uniref:Enoyl-CoA hydratase n=1 Tax=Variovorax paradoxus TaxID=34073 RepID=A0AAW8EPK0_VARPD|nr:enoyl-CoA hydratase/isomerase family protein [Variovorax paradoxus]MDP9974798.1 enoyl-CoA hydratase [Variovorax paradoxus]MDQ0027638.1 enoyl-CoA hydratase [Variovorax paradoxus]